MKYPQNTWNQLKNITKDDLIKALEKDGATFEGESGAVRGYRYPDGRRYTIHYHPKSTFGQKLLKGLLDDIGWSESDLKRLKLIK